MAQEDPGVSVIITDGESRELKRGEIDPLVQNNPDAPRRASNSDEKTPSGRGRGTRSQPRGMTEAEIVAKSTENKQPKSDDLDESGVKIQSILSHELFSEQLEGQARTDGILADLLTEDLITQEQHDKLVGTELKLDSVDDVKKVITGAKE